MDFLKTLRSGSRIVLERCLRRDINCRKARKIPKQHSSRPERREGVRQQGLEIDPSVASQGLAPGSKNRNNLGAKERHRIRGVRASVQMLGSGVQG